MKEYVLWQDVFSHLPQVAPFIMVVVAVVIKRVNMQIWHYLSNRTGIGICHYRYSSQRASGVKIIVVV